jgi:hypothetical protein
MALPQPDPYERLIINIGTQEDDGTGDPLRQAFDKVNTNFENLYMSTGLAGGLTFANLADTPVTYVTDAFLMVNDSTNGVAYAKVTPGSDISVSVTDPNITVTLKEVLTGHRRFVGSVDITNGLTVSGPLVANDGMDLSGNVVIHGNLQVTGNTVVKDTYINVDVVSTENEIIVSNTAPAVSTTTGALRVAGGAGIQGNLYSNNSYTGTAHNYRVFSDNGYFYSNGTPYLNQVSFNPLFDNQLATKTTNNLAEGDNLYYTNARARNAISGSGSLSYNSSTGVISYNTPSTSGIVEGANLYFTTDRARNSISVSGSLAYDNSTGVISYTTPSTSGISEGSNLYFTTDRARASISVTGWNNLSYTSSTGVINISAPSTSDVTEGSNLYYTTARVRGEISVTKASGDGGIDYNSSTGVITYTGPSAAEARGHFSAGTGIIYNSSTGVISADTSSMATASYVDTAISNLVNSAPSTLNTLNELATALGSDANFATTITNSIATKFATADFNSTFDTRLGTKSTNDLAEGSNLYFTTARARSSISVSGSLSYDNSTGVVSYTTPSTSGITEGTNLYYTDARARAAISATGSINYNSSTGVISFTMPSLVTTNVTEGTNLYYTDARARAAISVAGSGTYNSSTGVITVNGGVTSVNGQTGSVYVTLSDITGTAVDDLDMGGYKVTNVGTPVSGSDAATKSYVDSTVSSALVEGAGGGGLTIPPDFFKAFEVTADNAQDQGAGTTTIIGDTRIYQLDFSVSGTTRTKRYFYPYATVNAAYTLANGRLKYQYASVLPGKNTPIYSNGGSAQFYANGTNAQIYTDTTVEWTDIGTNVFQLPFNTGVNSVRIVIIGDGVHPNTFSNYIVKAFMPATTEYSTQNIGGLSSKNITFNNIFESVNNITITLNYQAFAWVTNQTNTGATINFSSTTPQATAYVTISGY